MTGDAVHRGGAGVHLRGHPQAGRQLRQAHPPPPDLVPGRQGRHVRGQGEDTAHIQFNNPILSTLCIQRVPHLSILSNLIDFIPQFD